MFIAEKNRLIYQYDAEKLFIEPWGQNSLRVRATCAAGLPGEDWALLPPEPVAAEISVGGDGAEMVNGRITAKVTNHGKLAFYDASITEQCTTNKILGANLLTINIV